MDELEIAERLARLEERQQAEAELRVQVEEAADRALTIATERLDHRLALMNEFREQLTQQSREFATKSEMAEIEKRYAADAKRFDERHYADLDRVNERADEKTGSLSKTLEERDRIYVKALAALSATQARLIGGVLLAGVIIPVITALVTYLLTRHAVELSPTP